MGMPTSGVYVLLAALVAPSLVQAGIDPIAAHLFILYFGMMSMITPPIALAAFAAAAIAKAPAMATGWAAMRFGWAAYVIPVLFAFSPTLILIGDPGAVAFAALTAMLELTHSPSIILPGMLAVISAVFAMPDITAAARAFTTCFSPAEESRS